MIAAAAAHQPAPCPPPPSHFPAQARLARCLIAEAGAAPAGVRSLVLLAAADTAMPPEYASWLARLIEAHAEDLAIAGQLDRATATHAAARLLRHATVGGC